MEMIKKVAETDIAFVYVVDPRLARKCGAVQALSNEEERAVASEVEVSTRCEEESSLPDAYAVALVGDSLFIAVDISFSDGRWNVGGEESSVEFGFVTAVKMASDLAIKRAREALAKSPRARAAAEMRAFFRD